ncbi:MAG TPA: hypothetical protein VLE22_14520 [Bryobacteraceae bacterium]|nr:hypothetical protein [Bryobacteraceae bacterium]
MNHCLKLFGLLFVFATLAATDQPVVYEGGVVNAASYGSDWLQNGGVAQGSMFVVFGSRMGPAVLQMATTFPLQLKLANTSIEVTIAGVMVNAIMLYAWDRQLAAVLPSRTPVGNGTLQVVYNDLRSDPVTIRVVETNFGSFAGTQAGSGPAIAQNYVSATETPLNSPIEAAHPGQVMILWGTGLGAVSFDETFPPLVQDLNVPLEVWIGGKRATVLYEGRSPQFPGIDQINLQLPADAPLGCYVPLAVKARGVTSNFTSIAISPSGKICSDPHGVSAADLNRLAAGEPLRLGWIQLMRENFKAQVPGIGAVEGSFDLGWADFFRWDASSVIRSHALSSWGQTALGTCTEITFEEEPNFAPIHPSRLVVGETMNLHGPLGIKPMPRDRAGLYEKNAIGTNIPPVLGWSNKTPFLEPGTYTVENGSGGPDATRFSVSLTIPHDPASLQWTNLESIQIIDRSRDLTVTWEGGNPDREYVLVGAMSSVGGLENAKAGVIVACAERVSAGRLVMPSFVLSTLPPSDPETAASMFVVIRAALPESSTTVAGGLDAIYSMAAEGHIRLVTYQ